LIFVVALSPVAIVPPRPKLVPSHALGVSFAFSGFFEVKTGSCFLAGSTSYLGILVP
jgi:hypothetical protein